MRPLLTCCIAVILISGGAPPTLSGQAVLLETLGIRDGLSQGFVSCLLLDREGFLWAGTKNGLNRYDGRQFKVFTSDPVNAFAISNDYVLSIIEHGDFLLIGTNGGGLNIFHKKTQRFYRLPDQLPGGQHLESPVVYKAFVDAQGHIWVHFWKEKTYLEGPVCRIRVPEGFWQRLGNAEQPWAGVVVDKPYSQLFRQIQMSRDGKNLWLVSEYDAFSIKTNTGQLETYPVMAKTGNISEDMLGNIWIPSQAGLIRFEKNKYQLISTDFTIRNIFGFDRQNRILLNAEPHGFLRLPTDKSTVALRYSDGESMGAGRTGDKAIIDRSDIIWLATLGYGLKKLNPRLGRFRTYFEGATIYSPPFADSTGTVAYFDFIKGTVFFPASSKHPLAVIREQRSNFRAYTRYVQDCAGYYWVYHLNNGNFKLLQVDASGRILQDYLAHPQSQSGGTMVLDNQCRIWIAHNGRFIRFDPVTKQFTHFDYSKIFPLGHEVLGLARTDNGHWWMATNYGLVEAIPSGAGFSFKLFKKEPDNPNSLRNENLSSLLVDPKDANLLWIGTKGGGLELLDTRSGKLKHLTTKDGLPNDVIYGILSDESGNLWLSSNQGLIRYNPATGVIKNFTEADGLLSNEFNTWAYAKTPAGELMFGGVNGLHVFNPKDWQDNPVVPPVYFTGLRVNNRNIEPGDSTGLVVFAPEWTKEITLPFGQNSIALDFAALEFSAPSKNRFRYYLEGAEAEWAHEGFEHSAQYLNLQPGRYTFKVMGSNNDGVWNPTPAVLKIVVLPPWYRSVWAYLFYVALLAGLVYGYIRFRLHRLRLQQQLDLEHLKAARLKELDEFKSRFFTNISHEFRTPLTVILGTADQLKQAVDQSEEKTNAGPPPGFLLSKIALLRRNGANLLRLVNQILDLAKLENNTLKINYIRGDVLAYLRYVAESLHSLANARNVLLRVESRSAAIDMDYDPERLMQIAHNLLSNAIKFTPSGGRVILRADETHAEGLPRLQLSVADSGAGIPSEELPRIFDRFYQAQNQGNVSGGTGIGLSLTKELVKAMGGNISVVSTVGKGSVFTVELPITRIADYGLGIADYGSVELTSPEQERNDIFPPSKNSVIRNPNSAIDHSAIGSLLLIEDNPDVVEYLSGCLEGMYQLDYAYNGRAGIEKALETVPDIIISDVMMPEKDGFEVCETLKNDERTSHIPIVLLTARAGVEDRIAGLRRGADAYLSKPFHPEELLVVLSNLLDLRLKLQAKYMDHSGPTPASGTQKAPVPDQETREAGPDPEDVFMQKLRSAVESRLAQADLSVEEISRMVGMSYPVVHRKVTALTGRSLTLYVRAVRLQKACILLADPARSIADVAYETGFNDPKFFSRVFSEEYGMSPSAFRQTEK